MGYVVNSDNIVYAATGGTGTLQDAINQAQTTKKPLYVAPGTYSTGDLVISAPVEIYATPGTVVLQPSSATNGFTLNVRSNTAGATITDVTIRGLTFNGANKAFATQVNTTERYVIGQYLNAGNFNAIISAYKVTRLNIRECSVGFSGSNGIAMWQCTAVVENNDFPANKLCAIYSCDGWSTVLANNFVRNGANAGIVACRQNQGFDGTIIRDNRIHAIGATANTTAGQVSGSGWYGNGIYLYHTGNAVVQSNVMLDCKFSGIRLLAAWNCIVSDNQIYQCGETGLFVEAPGGTPSETNVERYEGGIVSNNVVDNAGIGISVVNVWWGGRRVVITGNTVTNITKRTITTNDPDYPTYQTTGAGIVAEGDVVVTGNFVEGATQGPGIVLYPGQISGSTKKITALASANTVKNSSIGIGFFKDYASGFSFIGANILEGYSNGSIVPVNLPGPAYANYTRIGTTDYGTMISGTYTGKPFTNVMIGLNFAI